MEWGTAYNIFHWVISAWSMYALTALPIAYVFYVRKVGNLKLSVLLQSIVGTRFSNKYVFKAVDIIFIFSAIGGFGIILGLSIPLVSMVITEIVGIENSFSLQVGIVIFISVLYSLSSYLGIEKGMQNIITLMYIEAPLSTVQTGAFIGTVPLIFILMVMIVVLFKWIYTDYGYKSADDIFKSENEKINK